MRFRSVLEYDALIVSTERKPQRIAKPHSSLFAWRTAQGWGQREAAEYLGITQSCYSKWERHEQAPRRYVARVVTEKTGVPLDELMGIAS